MGERTQGDKRTVNLVRNLPRYPLSPWTASAVPDSYCVHATTIPDLYTYCAVGSEQLRRFPICPFPSKSCWIRGIMATQATVTHHFSSGGHSVGPRFKSSMNCLLALGREWLLLWLAVPYLGSQDCCSSSTAAYLRGCFGFAVSLSPKRLSDNDKAGISGSIPSTQISLRSVRSQGPLGVLHLPQVALDTRPEPAS